MWAAQAVLRHTACPQRWGPWKGADCWLYRRRCEYEAACTSRMRMHAHARMHMHMPGEDVIFQAGVPQVGDSDSVLALPLPLSLNDDITRLVIQQ